MLITPAIAAAALAGFVLGRLGRRAELEAIRNHTIAYTVQTLTKSGAELDQIFAELTAELGIGNTEPEA